VIAPVRLRVYIFLWIVGFSPLSDAQWFEAQKQIMGTEILITLWADTPEQGQHAIDAVVSIFEGVDQRLSPYKPHSDLSKLNREALTQSVTLSDELLFLLTKSEYWNRLTEGAFDITYASVGRFYDYRRGLMPSQAELSALRPAINAKKWLLLDHEKGRVTFMHPKLAIDLGGIAKGYAVDLAIETLVRRGIANAYVSAGGDSRLLGDKRGRPWMIGIKNPRSDASAPVIRLPLESVAVSTSGDYERFFMDETGRRHHHIINPKTGQSAADVMSVTVLGPAGVDTDALSTGVFVMGVQAGLALINRLEGFDAIIIDNQGKVHFSQGLAPPADTGPE
jgi:FAD:protein FMN transferase